MKLDKRFYREQVPLTIVAAIVGGWTVGVLSRDERLAAKAVVVEQDDKIRRLQAIIDGKVNADGVPCACPEANLAECIAPAEARCEDAAGDKAVTDSDATHEKLLTAGLRACADGARSVAIMAKARHECAEAAVIHGVIDGALSACVDVLGSTGDTSKIKTAQESVTSLEKSHKNHRISPVPCGLK